MSGKVILFKYEQQNMRVILDKNGEPWFIGKDICDILGLKNVSQATQKMADDEKLIQKMFVSGRDRVLLTISESGLYALVAQSNKPEAGPFGQWVTHDMLPLLRKMRLCIDPGSIAPALSAVNNSRTLLDRALVMEGSVRIFKAAVSIARAAGLKGRAALVKANAITLRTPGTIDCLQELGIQDQDINEKDQIPNFVSARCILGEGRQGEVSVSPPVLYQEYKEYIAEMGVDPLGKQFFYRQLKDHCPKVRRLRKSYSSRDYFFGIGLNDSPDDMNGKPKVAPT